MSYKTHNKPTQVLPKNFDINKISYEKMTDKDGKKQIFIKYDGSMLQIQTPMCVAPFGVSKPNELYPNNTDWTMDIDLDSIDAASGVEGSENLPEKSMLEKNLSDFKNLLVKLDAKNCEHLYNEHKKLWPGDDIENISDVRKAHYGALVKKSISKKNPDTKYSDKFRSKFPQPYKTDKKDKSFLVYDRFGKEVDWYSDECQAPYDADWSKGRMLVQAIVICSGLWIVGPKAYCSFKIQMIRHWSPSIGGNLNFVIEDGETVPDVSTSEKLVDTEDHLVEEPEVKDNLEEEESYYSDEEEEEEEVK
jgi:hypothetical protein